MQEMRARILWMCCKGPSVLNGTWRA